MAKIDVFDVKNSIVGSVDLHDAILDYPVNTVLIHEVVKMQLACRRAGTHATKTKGLVSGGGRKPWKQKGTGRARAGSSRSPLWRGGGTIFGPQPRDYSYSMPKKKVKNALRSAIHAKYDAGAVVVLDSLFVENGKTKEAVEILKAFNADRRVLIVVDVIDEKVARAKENEITEIADIIETEDYDSPPRYELPKVPEGYIMDEETARDFFACNDRDDLKKLLAKLKEKILEC